MRTRTDIEPAAVVLSIDTEQIWGYFDLFGAGEFRRRYPDAVAIHDRLLRCLCAAGISATWTIVGGMSLAGSNGAADRRFTGLPPRWIAAVPAGDESTAPLWYRRAFAERLRDAMPAQDIGLHGGISHLIWTHGEEEVAWRELSCGVQALEEIGIRPRSFVYPRDLGAHHHLLPAYGIHAFRGRGSMCSERLGQNLPGAFARVVEELGRFVPLPVWPEEVLPGLWNIPPSLFLYSLGTKRSRVVPSRLRLRRVRDGVEAAMRWRGIFHLGFHPENLAESPEAFPVFESIIEYLVACRDRGDIRILSMQDAVNLAVRN